MKAVVLKTLFFFTSIFPFLGFSQMAVVPEKTNILDSKISLNGKWQFCENYSGSLIEISKSNKEWKDIIVPGEWIMQEFTVEKGNMGVYSRNITIPKEWEGSNVFLRCDGVYSKAELLINGSPISSHIGPLIIFERDVSSIVKFGKSNNITIGITSETLADTLMTGSQYAAHQLGGILRKIYLYAVPKNYLADLRLSTDLDSKYQNGVLNINAVLKCTGKSSKVMLISKLFDIAGKEVPFSETIKDFFLDKGGMDIPLNLTMKVTDPAKWDAEHPNLYRLSLEVKSEDGFELISKDIGFRKIEISGNKLFVNGKPIKLKGVNRHEVDPLLGRSLNNDIWEKDAKIFKNGNVNFIRTSHYPPAEEFIDWCDKLGLYVELENPFCWVGHGANPYWKNHDSEDKTLYSYFEKVAHANINFFGNHPSILIWSMANESKWTSNWSKLADFYTKEDPDRPVTFHDQAFGKENNFGSTKMPISNIHYPEHYHKESWPKISEDSKRPLLFGEYQHLNTYNREELTTDPGVRDSWGRSFQKIWNEMYKSSGCLGGSIWSGIDDVFFLPDDRVVGYGEWGVIDGWRREKPEYFHMKKGYSPVLIHNEEVKIQVPGEDILLQIENRFDFTNLKECSIVWQIDSVEDTVSLDLAPHQFGVLRICAPRHINLEGKNLIIRIISPQGIEVDKSQVRIGQNKKDDMPFTKVGKSIITVNDSNDMLKIKGADFEWNFDKNAGKLIKAKVNNSDVITNGAELMILSLKTGACLTEHSLKIPAHNQICTENKIKSFNWKFLNDSVSIDVVQDYEQATGKINYCLTANGELIVNYLFESKTEINPRQYGLVFSVPIENGNLEWYRKGLWSWYPENHIGRNIGKAIPFIQNKFQMNSRDKDPYSEWRNDSNDLGTNDFRATRENIYWVTLTNEKCVGVAVLSSGNQAFRSYVNPKGVIDFLVADFSTGGASLFLSTSYEDEYKNIIKGSELKGTVKLQLVKAKF